jgi:ABC-type glycerol-3-phosphate transport system permease component
MKSTRKSKLFSRKSLSESILHICVSLLFLTVCLTYVYILVWGVIAACKTHTEIVLDPFGMPKKWHWEHFVEVFTSLEVGGHNFWHMLFNSLYFSVLGPFIAQITTASFAYCCTRYKFPGSNLPYTIILIMMTLPIYGMAGSTYKILHSLGFINSYTYILTSITGMSAGFLYYRAYFQNMSWSYVEAAQMDGANDFQVYLRVMLPMAKPIFGALFLTGWLSSWNGYSTALVHHPDIPTLPVGIYQFNIEMMYRARLDILFAACILVCIPALILFAMFSKIITTNVSLGGIKG